MVPVSPRSLRVTIQTTRVNRAGLARRLSLAHRQGVKVSPIAPKEAWRAHTKLYQQPRPAADRLLGPRAPSPRTGAGKAVRQTHTKHPS